MASTAWAVRVRVSWPRVSMVVAVPVLICTLAAVALASAFMARFSALVAASVRPFR